jgi:hypothetical protein
MPFPSQTLFIIPNPKPALKLSPGAYLQTKLAVVGFLIRLKQAFEGIVVLCLHESQDYIF